ncbi:hypothetical protein JGK52_17220 [Cytobacillus oceanisediminis]|uniref:hypothetical protein n=1 Tax=Cytobacillus oceanisediminis TaxID=665099 RepID=UPI001D14DCD3|nr:hypothetical protein [Cytobacillus oceanisediminis]MCC3648407.1 hypothetical protein [Cytobacillus oceanisediminis]
MSVNITNRIRNLQIEKLILQIDCWNLQIEWQNLQIEGEILQMEQSNMADAAVLIENSTFKKID